MLGTPKNPFLSLFKKSSTLFYYHSCWDLPHNYQNLLHSEVKFCLFQVVKRAAIATSFIAAIGGALTVLRILKKDLKLLWEVKYCLIITIKRLLLEINHCRCFSSTYFIDRGCSIGTFWHFFKKNSKTFVLLWGCASCHCAKKKPVLKGRISTFITKWSTKQQEINIRAMFPEGIQGHMQNLKLIWAKTKKHMI